MTDTATQAPRIAIVGTEGSGKTVLITMLAKQFSQIDGSIFLNPMNNSTLKFVERMHAILRDGDWPPSTPMGHCEELAWQIDIPPNHTKCEIRLVDCAGQDLRRLFGQDGDISILPEHLRGLYDYCRTADIVICLVNLKDVVGHDDSMTGIDNQAVIKSALDHVTSDPTRSRRLCLLFTQADRYRAYVVQHGSWTGVAKAYLPYVYAPFLQDGQVIVDAVAAVDKTELANDDTARRVPAPWFGSDGLHALGVWIVAESQKLNQQRQAKVDAGKFEWPASMSPRWWFPYFLGYLAYWLFFLPLYKWFHTHW